MWQRGKPYSQDLRGRVLATVDGGMQVAKVARLYRVSVSYIYKALGRRRATGEVSVREQRGHREPKLLAYHDTLRGEVERRPDATLEELKAWLLQRHGVSCCIATVAETLKRLDLTLKKSRCARPNKIART